MYSEKIRKLARSLRAEGISLLQIAKKLKISKSTASLWVSDVVLPQWMRDRLVDNSVVGRDKAFQILRAKREFQKMTDYKDAGVALDSVLRYQDIHFWQFSTALLFWCEGSKRSLSYLKFTNSDPSMVKLFLHGLRLGFRIDEKRLRPLIHLHDYHEEKDELAFWSGVTGVPVSQFYRSYRKPNTGHRKREGYHGCICIGYPDATIAKKLSALYHVFAQKIVGP